MGLLAALFFLLPSTAAAFAGDCVIPDWDPAAPLTGTLTAGECTLRDMIPGSVADSLVKPYRIDVVSRGVYNFDLAAAGFEGILILTDTRFRQIAPGDTRTAATRFSVSLAPETYYLLVIAVRGTGEFTLSGVTEDPSTCQVKDLQPGAIPGQIATGACRLQHAIPASDQARPAEIYRFQTSQPQVFSALMESRAVDSLLVLLDAKTGSTLAVDDDGADGVANALIIRSLAPGEYLLVATVAGAQTGAFNLRADLADPQACNTRDINPGASASGQLTGADCRLLDVVAGDDRENRLELFRLRVTDPGILTVEVRSNEFFAAALLFSADNRLLQSAVPQQVNQPARLAISLAPGEYLIGAAHAELIAGNYQLQTRFEGIRTCLSESLPLEGVLNSALGTADCRFQDRVPLSSDATLIKPHTVTLEKRGVLTVEMTSPQLDSYLWVLDAENRVIAEDDNLGGGRNARVSVQLNPGVYAVFANTTTVQTGSFEIKAAFNDPAPCEAPAIAPGETVKGQLLEQDCALRDVMLADGRGTSADPFKLTLAAPGILTLDLSAFTFAPSLILLDSEGRRIASDALVATAAAGVSHLRRELPAGTYTIVATATAGRAGDYTLRSGLRTISPPPE